MGTQSSPLRCVRGRRFCCSTSPAGDGSTSVDWTVVAAGTYASIGKLLTEMVLTRRLLKERYRPQSGTTTQKEDKLSYTRWAVSERDRLMISRDRLEQIITGTFE